MKMTEQEIKDALTEYCKDIVRKASDKLATFTRCEQIYNEMCALGYVEQMQVFKNIIFLTICLHPDWSEYQVLIDFCKNTGIKV